MSVSALESAAYMVSHNEGLDSMSTNFELNGVDFDCIAPSS